MILKNNSQTQRKQTLLLFLLLWSLQISCRAAAQNCNPDSLPAPRASFAIADAPVTKVATEISRGVGKVVASSQGSKNQTVFIFEERHDSRIGQMEIALMLWRLHKINQLGKISLEGALASQGALAPKWFHDATLNGPAKQAGQEAAVRLLREGEISDAEFIALTLADVTVKGNEIESEYRVEASKSNATMAYLVAIAERSLGAAQVGQINELIGAKKTDEALQLIFSNDPWVRERYDKLFGNRTVSTEESVVLLDEIEAKVRSLGLNIEPQQALGLQDDRKFYQTASRRSCTISNNTLAMMNSPAPVALIAGAAHTEKLVELFKNAGVSYAVLSPLSLIDGNKASNMSAPMYERKMKLKSTDDAGMLGALLDGRKKLPPVLDTEWFRTKTELYTLIDLLATEAARTAPFPSPSVRETVQALGSLKVDWTSLKVNRDRDRVVVTVKVTVQLKDGTSQRAIDLWIAGWHQPPPPPPAGGLQAQQPSDSEPDIEKLIEGALAEDRIAKSPPPRQEVAVVQLSTQTRAAFTTDPNLLQQVNAAR